MKRYWDYSEKERAAFTSEQVESLMAAELMEAGVVRVEQPEMLPTDMPEIQASALYTIKCGYSSPTYAFRTAEDASKALSLALALDHDYIGGNYYHKTNPKREMTIEAVAIYDGADLANFRSSAEKMAANKDANDAALKLYQEACKSVDAVVQGVWADWHNCQATRRRYQKIIDTHTEYSGICDGDESKARVFLAKAFPQPDIDAAFDWFGRNVAAA